jgi:hypothetical protein
MKKIIFISTFYFFSCIQSSNQKKDTNVIDNEVLDYIKSYYKTEYGKGTRLEESESDTIADLVYYNIPKDSNDYDGLLIGITIPKKVRMNLFDAEPILYGDLNNDGIEEIVITVHIEGSGAGGNTSTQELFVFQKINGKYKIITITNNNEISYCQSGIFRAKEIKNGILIGNSYCYKEEDPRCCPSLEYITKVQLIKNKLILKK